MLAPILGPPDDDETPDRPIGTDPWSQALGPLGRGYQALFRGAVNEAEHGLKAALARFRAIGERWGMMQAISELSRLVSSRGDHAEALMLINEGIEMVRELGATADIAELLHARGACRARAADVPGARADYEQSIELARQSGAPEILARSLAGLADLALEAGDHAATRDYATSALAACGSEGFGSDGTRAAILITLARVAAGDEAISLLRNALGNAQRWRNLDTAASVAEALAELTPVPEDAARLFGASVALRGMVVSGSPVASGPAYTEGRALSHAEALDLLDQTFCVLTTKFEK
jgi:tetratricopeptide (TPR) repeat protein